MEAPAEATRQQQHDGPGERSRLPYTQLAAADPTASTAVPPTEVRQVGEETESRMSIGHPRQISEEPQRTDAESSVFDSRSPHEVSIDLHSSQSDLFNRQLERVDLSKLSPRAKQLVEKERKKAEAADVNWHPWMDLGAQFNLEVLECLLGFMLLMLILSSWTIYVYDKGYTSVETWQQYLVTWLFAAFALHHVPQLVIEWYITTQSKLFGKLDPMLRRHDTNHLVVFLQFFFFFPLNTYLVVQTFTHGPLKLSQDAQFIFYSRTLLVIYVMSEWYDLTQRRRFDFNLHAHHLGGTILVLLVMEWLQTTLRTRDAGLFILGMQSAMDKLVYFIFPLEHVVREHYKQRKIGLETQSTSASKLTPGPSGSTNRLVSVTTRNGAEIPVPPDVQRHVSRRPTRAPKIGSIRGRLKSKAIGLQNVDARTHPFLNYDTIQMANRVCFIYYVVIVRLTVVILISIYLNVYSDEIEPLWKVALPVFVVFFFFIDLDVYIRFFKRGWMVKHDEQEEISKLPPTARDALEQREPLSTALASVGHSIRRRVERNMQQRPNLQVEFSLNSS